MVEAEHLSVYSRKLSTEKGRMDAPDSGQEVKHSGSMRAGGQVLRSCRKSAHRQGKAAASSPLSWASTKYPVASQSGMGLGHPYCRTF